METQILLSVNLLIEFWIMIVECCRIIVMEAL